jgi:hypothetical protein
MMPGNMVTATGMGIVMATGMGMDTVMAIITDIKWIRSKGATVQWHNGATVQRCKGITVQRHNGITA